VISRRRWEDNIKTDLKEILRESLDWIQLAQDSVKCLSLVNTIMNLPLL
jgi:hypothetical protein